MIKKDKFKRIKKLLEKFQMKQRLKNSRFFDKKFLPLKFIRETLAIDDVKGKVDKEIIHISIVKSVIKNTLSR